MRALQIAELDHGRGRVGRAVRRSSYAFFQRFSRVRKGVRAERHNISRHGVLAVRRDVQLQSLLTLSSAN